MRQYRVTHRTIYDYGAAVVMSMNEARLSPRQLGRQAVSLSRLEVDPVPESVSRRRDYFGNGVTFFGVRTPHRRLTVTAESRVDVAKSGVPADPASTAAWEDVAASLRRPSSNLVVDAAQFVVESRSVRRSESLREYAAFSFPRGRPVMEGVIELNHRIFSDFRYDPEATTVQTPVEEVLRDRRGVCQDFSHLMIGCLRSLGIPARYVSGYVGPAGDSASGSDVSGDLVGAHASHAWVAVFCGGSGWIEVDPTNDVVVSDQHVVLGWGRDFEDVSPIKGLTLGGGRHDVSVEVRVEPVSA